MPGWRARWHWVYLAVPMLFCLAVHWLALKTWFVGDDFAWLSLAPEIRKYNDWLEVLFGPRAQGTVRTLSERAYFLGLGWLFGLNPLPFRIWAFLTQFANLALLGSIARRVTGSVAAGVIAPVLWSACGGLATPLNWSSAYNEICCAFFMLAAFWLLLKYIDTGDKRYWVWQWAAYLLGFGALELIVMYPAIAALYALLCARKYFVRTLWLFLPAAAFTCWHLWGVPKSMDPQYAMHFDTDIAVTLVQYWTFATGAYRPEMLDWRPVWLGIAVACAVALGMAAMVVRRGRVALWCVGWFILALLPVLPLSGHFTQYYVTIPAIGLAILGGWAVAEHPKAAGALALAYLVVSICEIRVTDRFQYQRARSMKNIVTGLEDERAGFSGKRLILGGVDNALFWSGFKDDPFQLVGIDRVYLMPGSEKAIDPHRQWGGIDRFILPLENALDLLDRGQAAVFQVQTDGKVNEVTPSYKVVAGAEYLAEHRGMVDVGKPLYISRLGEGWYGPENGFRWMGKRAAVVMGGPSKAGIRLAVSGYCPAVVVANGPVELTASVNGREAGRLVLREPNEKFEWVVDLPSAAVGTYAMTVAVEVSRTTRIGTDTRPLGMVFGTFKLQGE